MGHPHVVRLCLHQCILTLSDDSLSSENHTVGHQVTELQTVCEMLTVVGKESGLVSVSIEQLSKEEVFLLFKVHAHKLVWSVEVRNFELELATLFDSFWADYWGLF